MTEPHTIRWITPRIRYLEYTDSYGDEYCDIAYNMWRVKKQTWQRIKTSIEEGRHELMPRQPWYLVETDEPRTEERRFLYLPDGGVEKMSRYVVQQFVRNYGNLLYWHPGIEELVLRDIDEFINEDPDLEKEYERWYKRLPRDQYRKPQFFRDFLDTKIPMEED